MTTESEGFAQLLRRFKERSGRSYGVLAEQLHMSVSTLHRYCNGDAVPMDFAPAERFARLCGAQREELLELHRQWIVADEARRRGRSLSARVTSSAAVAEAAPAADAAADAPADPPESAARASDATDDAPAGQTDAEGRIDAEGLIDTERRTGTEGRPHRSPESLPASHARDGGAASSASEGSDNDQSDVVAKPMSAGSGSGSGSDVHSSTVRERRPLVRLVALAVATLAIPAALTFGRGSWEDSSRTGTQGRQGTGRYPVAGEHPTSMPKTNSSSDSATSPGAAATPGGKGARTPSPSAQPDAPGASRSPAGGGQGPAPRVGISSYNWDEPCDVNYLLRQAPDHVPPPPPPQDVHSWARALGGIDGGHLRLQLTATGNADEAVVLTSLHVRVTAKHAAVPWRAYSMGDGCGSGVTPQSFEIDLDTDRPTAKPVAGQDGDVVVPAKGFPFKVSARDPQVLNLDLHTEGHDVSYYLEIGWSSGARQGTLRIDDGGKPFRISAITDHDRYSYRSDQSKWRPSRAEP
ncbi:helix-turn-helix domain-containing protein [Streptomyces sp. NPDC048506]|uniref:helix-turn-helix domain-containing protein n=1 Tax=Streptomyces sp. NPDC048506 TaxID=3155028 RepID=UPI00344240AE